MTDGIDEARLDDALVARFHRLQRGALPENWGRAVERAENLEMESKPPRRWWAGAAASVLVIGGIAAIAAMSRGGSPFEDVAAPASTVVSNTNPESAPTDPPATSTLPIVTSAGRGLAAFGSAMVVPSRATAGDVVTVTPDGLIQPTCTDLGGIFDVDGSGPARLGVIGGSEVWLPEMQRPTLPACLPPETDQPFSYVVPAGLGQRTVAICRSAQFDEAACGPLEIVIAADGEDAGVSVPVVEGLTEGEAVSTIRLLGLVAVIERVEVEEGDTDDGRVMFQRPAAATSVTEGDEVRITVGQASAREEIDS